MTRALRPIALLLLLTWLAAPAALVSAAAAQQPSTWNAIQERGSLRIGATQAPPWHLKDPQSGDWSGLGIAVGRAMAETLGVELEIVEVTWGQAIAALQADKIDVNSENVAAFQSGRADAASLFHPPLIALQKQMGKGRIVLPQPIRASASSAAVRREADKTWRDWVSTATAYDYETNQTQVWYDEFLESFGVDPDATPPIRKELW